ncbi:MAG: hypothetical protein K2F63_02500, partial [Muribaculaceae bacterium]|nr:hypothetical protein [Muribaculaceae bacterium]
MLKRFFISVLGTMAGLWISIGLLVFAGIVAAGVLVAKGTSGQITEVKDKSVLYFDLSGVVSERYQPTNIFELIQSGQSGPSLTLDEMIGCLQA